jgi:hypothetical protein
MSKAQDRLNSQAERLRRQLAEAEAVCGQLKNKLARIEAKLTGGPAPSTGLDLLWKAARPIARTRSSKILCRTEWNRIPAHERPTIQTILDALTVWNRCLEWKKDGGAFIPGLHRWIKNRQWENLPEDARPDPAARYRSTTKTPPVQELTAEDKAALAEFLKFRPTAALAEDTSPKRMPS